MPGRLISLIAVALCAAMLAHSQPAIQQGGVTNAASLRPHGVPGGGIAPGSIVLVRGSGLGPQTELAGVSVVIVRGDEQWPLPVLSASDAGIRALVPPSLPPGPAGVVVSFSGNHSDALPIAIVPASFGIFTLSGDGLGPVTESTVSHGERITILGTGLGTNPRDRLPEVFVGDRPAHVLRAGPKPGSPGTDEIEFEIPDDAPRGCYVPLQVRVAGSVPSNTATLAIDPEPRTCMEIHRVGRYLGHAGRAGFVLPVHLSMRIDLQPSGKTDYEGDAILAAFRRSFGGGTIRQVAHPPPLGYCAVHAAPVGSADLSEELGNALLPEMELLDAGVLEVGEPDRQITVTPPADRQVYYHVLGGDMPGGAGEGPLFLTPGELAVSGPGGPDVDPFAVKVRVAEPIIWTNRNRFRTLRRDREAVVKWKLQDTEQLVVVAGISIDEMAHATAGFYCLADGGDGSLRIPSNVLQSLPAARDLPGQTQGYLFLAAVPANYEFLFYAPGVDILAGLGVSLDGRSVRFR